MGDEEKASTELENYLVLKDLSFRIGEEEEEQQETTFSLCFWLYLVKSISFPLLIVQEVDSNVPENFPFLVVNEKKVTIFPLLLLPKEAPDSPDPISSPHLSIEFEFPLEKWVHFGIEGFSDSMKLHINGEIAGERTFSSAEKDSLSDGFKKITLASGDKNNNRGYIYNLKSFLFPTTWCVKDHYSQDLPVKLYMDKSSADEIEEGDGGIWSIVGGKASCRRNFSLDVVLVDEFDQPVITEIEVVASLMYLDDGAPVERTSDGEAPLLASYDGIEYASHDLPSKLLHGRASFRLKISQLSSKCQNRLFCIVFHLHKKEAYPFFEAFSPPIRSISRSKNTRLTPTALKRSTSSLQPISQLCGLDEDPMDVQRNSLHGSESDPSSKCLRTRQDRISSNSEHPDEECNSHAGNGNKVEDALMTSSTLGPENYSVEENSSTDSESTEVRESVPKSTSTVGSLISDMTVFKYGLADISERSLILKEIANSASDEAISDFAHQISLFSGCLHHSNQIMMAKRLVEEGTKAWNSVSQNNSWVPWESLVFEIKHQFMKISRCSSRSLLQQDLELLRKISGCQGYVSQENFEKMWCWLFPVAHTLSRDFINATWSCTTPKWIEGFITKEEAESSLQGPSGVQEPGTFLIRFPTSRSWPHPDAGSLVVTYVGINYSLHHRLLSLDTLYSPAGKYTKSLQEMLLEEPELSRLGRIIRSA